MAAALLWQPAMVVWGVPASVAAAAPRCAASAADEAAAVSMALACGSRVEVEAARTEYSQTFAQDSGAFTVETSVVPQRARRPDGGWGAIDPSLRRVGERLVPMAAAANVWFSTGGDGPFATMTVEGRTMTMSWPGTLPAPEVRGDTATYADVVPDVDLVVRATDAGFSHSLVVRSARGAADPRVRRGVYRIGGDVTVESTQDGGLVARAGETTVVSAAAPEMWDSADNLSEREMAMSGLESRPREVKAVSAQANGRELVLIPDTSLLDGGRFPITVDPIWNPGVGQWNYATNNNTNAPTTDGTIAAGDPSPAALVLRAGDDTTGRLQRSFFRFTISNVAGKHILDAGIAGKVDHTWKCGVNYPNYFYRTAGISTTPRQSWPGPAMQLLLGNISVHANEASCNEPNKTFELSTSTLINDVQTSANNSVTYYTIGVCACSTSGGSGETIQERWMRYFVSDFRLNISYNTKPGVPNPLTVDNKACATGANRPFIKTTTPTLRAKASDADNNSMTVRFETARIKHDATAGPISLTLQQTSIPNGGTGQVNLPAGVLDTTDTIVGTGDWDKDGQPDVLSRDGAGELYLLPGTGNGNLESRTRVGHGFSGYTFAGMTDWDADGHQDFIVREDATGILWLYTGNSQRGPHGSRFQIGSGWGTYAFAGLSDWDRDGHQDIQARDSAGVMWLYPGESTRVGSTQTRATLGSGWSTSGVTYFGSKDWDRDGNPDLVIYDGAGTLWGYPGTGTRALYGARFQLGAGWTGFDGALIADAGGDGKVDILANPANQTHWVIYAGTGDRTFPGPAPYTVATVGTSDRAQFAYRANAYDGTDWAPNPSAWCEFEVDTRPPSVPSVTADLYAEGQTRGSVGQTGRFTFASSSDTQSFLYGFSDPPTTPLNPAALGGPASFDYTPTSGGPKTLYVRAIDRAGNESNRLYQFIVAPPTNALVRWKMNDDPGATMLADDTGNGRTAALFNGATLGVPGRIAPGLDGLSRTALGFDGVDDFAETTNPVIADTSKSFSMAAWVKIDAADAATHHILSQSGTNASIFFLEYNVNGAWRIVTTDADVASPVYTATTATSVPRAGTWTHLVATYDSAAKTMRLFVNGALEGTTTGITTWDANGRTRVGSTSRHWKGAMAEIQMWDRMLTTAEVFDLSDPVKVGKVGEWRMEEVGFGPAFDGSGLAHDLTFWGGAQIPSLGAGQTGTGLRLDGVDDYASTGEPVLYTDQSFTVSAWVRVTAITSFENFLAQESTQTNPGFVVYYDNSNNQWKFKTYASGTSDETTATLAAATATTPTSYHHLVGVFDAQKRELRLYVDNTLVVTRALNAAWTPWNSTGRLLIGQGQGSSSPAFADMDEVRVYQGVVTDVTRIP